MMAQAGEGQGFVEYAILFLTVPLHIYNTCYQEREQKQGWE
jgi:hypothetical protein